MTTVPVQVGPYTIGSGSFCVVAGPCSIESEDQFRSTARHVRSHGASMLRGGMFKLRTSPKTFQGLGTEALTIAARVRTETQMPFFSEITDPRQIDSFMPLVDVFQVGSRNMHNYALLKELGQTGKPVLLKRGFSGLIDEWLHAADYVVQAGKSQVILCERGIRTFETRTRNTFDLNAVAYVKQYSSFPVIADPSHATGRRSLVPPMALAAAAAGADGLIVEVHPDPEHALSDGDQALTFDDFGALMQQLRRLLIALDRPLVEPVTPRPAPEIWV